MRGMPEPNDSTMSRSRYIRISSLFRGMDNVQYIPTEKRQNPRELYGILSALKPDMVADMHHVLRTIGMDWLFRLHGVPVYGIRKHDRRGIASWQRYDRVFEHCGLKGSVSLGDYWQVKPSDGRPRVVGVAPFAQHQGKVWPLGKMESGKLGGAGMRGSSRPLQGAEIRRKKSIKSLSGSHAFLALKACRQEKIDRSTIFTSLSGPGGRPGARAEESWLAEGWLHAKVGFAHLFAGEQVRGAAFHGDAAVLHDVAAVRDAQGLVGVLLDQKDSGAVGIDLLDDAEDLLDDDGRKA